MAEYKLEIDEPWTVLNKRGNPEKGRRLTFELEDGTLFFVEVNMATYRQPELVKAKLQEQIDAYRALRAL